MLRRLPLLCLACVVFAQEDPLSRPDVRKALAWIEQHNAQTIEKQIAIAEVPSSTFQEDQRGKYMAAEFRRLGLQNIETDKRKNVLGWRPGRSPRALVVAAHLDTVFPPGTDFRVKREGSRLVGPGIGDDARGLAALLTIIEALDAARIATNHTLLFVADCCEEGLGDLLGVKQLLKESQHKDRIDGFISIDGTNPSRIVNGALASKRYRVTVRGPGGHSYGNFGRANPAHALGRIIAHFADLEVPANPRTTYNVGKIGGGTSINSIPFEAWMEVDMRSESEAELEKLEQRMLACVRQGMDEENRFRAKSGTRVEADPKLVARRYGGLLPESTPLVQAAEWAVRALGMTPMLQTGSTDANVPINMGMQAVTLGGGGIGASAHSLQESWEPVEAWKGPQQVLLTVLKWDR